MRFGDSAINFREIKASYDTANPFEKRVQNPSHPSPPRSQRHHPPLHLVQARSLPALIQARYCTNLFQRNHNSCTILLDPIPKNQLLEQRLTSLARAHAHPPHVAFLRNCKDGVPRRRQRRLGWNIDGTLGGTADERGEGAEEEELDGESCGKMHFWGRWRV